MASPYADRFFGADIAAVDPLVDTLIGLEEERQRRRIILIPSESYAPQSVRQALGSVFTNIYAEGYPPSQMVGNDEDLLADLAQQLAAYRRYADRRFYKGTDYVHFVETLAQRRAASCFARHARRPIDEAEIRVNVQPLSGAAANLAVYDALMEPGDTLMGMDLYQGGHLTHGSEFNVSGKQYRVVSYGVSSRDHRLDYGEILRTAEAARPKVIVAGYTSYPWAPDWDAFRRIADSVGAYLVADIAHPAGMVVAGQYPNPVGIADVTTFTTHKTLCGPRGACILTTDEDLARRIDSSVFPGIQGGPHTNKFAAMCLTFQIARTEPFADLQRRIVENAQALAKGLTDRGLELAYGGTDTHLLLLDLKSIRHPNKHPLYGEVVARILELAGIVTNKNTIPGDTVTALGTGVRMGTPWITQRGMGPAEMDRLAECITRIVRGITPFSYEGRLGPLPRGKIDLDVLEEARWIVDEMACSAQAEIEGECSDYPHYCLRPRERRPAVPLFGADAPGVKWSLTRDTVLVDRSDMGIVRVSGWRARPFLDDLCTTDISAVGIGQGTQSVLLDANGQVIDDLTLWRMAADERGRDTYLVLTHPENTDRVLSWMRAISDGYTLFDDQDVWRKVRGPVTVEVAGPMQGERGMAAIAIWGPLAEESLRQALGEACPAGIDPWDWVDVPVGPRSVMVARSGFGAAVPGYDILGALPDLGTIWEALARLGAKPMRAPDARHTLRRAVGLPPSWPADERIREAAPYVDRLPHLYDLDKPYFVGQDKLPPPSTHVAKRPFAWTAPTDTPPKRTALYEEHVGLGAKIISFAGWEMPVWYTSVGEEHVAVRERAGLFDVAHMGTLEVSGPHAVDLMDLVGVNYVRWLQNGDSQYSALLDADGHILDDILIYRRAWDRFFVVVNAANFDKDWAWLNAVNENQVLIDKQRPWVSVLHPAILRDLKDPASGPEQRVDIALQGPKSLPLLLDCAEDPLLSARLARLQRTKFVEGTLGGIDLLISRTGYTGEDAGYELYVHPDHAAGLWNLLLERGAPYGVAPCGLAARDSTRIEAGLPLYGHELGGELEISPNEAGYASYVKYHKPFFIGRTPYKARNDGSTRRIVRFQVSERGARALRGGEPAVNRRGRVIGTVTSCTLVGDRQIGMALIDGRYAEPGTELLIYPQTRGAVCKSPQELELGDTVALAIDAVVLSRFPERGT